MRKPKVKKISDGTYRVTFTKDQSYTVIIPKLWLEMDVPESYRREIAIDVASEQLPSV